MKYFLFLLYVIVCFVPYFGTIDKIGSQWLYISIINICIFFYLSINYNYLSLIRNYFKFNHIKVYFIFILFCLFSFFFTKNWTLSVVDFSRIVSTFFLSFNIYHLISDSKLKLSNISLIISLVLFFEIIASLIPFYDFLKSYTIYEIDFASIPNALRGVTGNKNIFAADIVFKIPFVLYLAHSGSLFQKIFSHFLFLLSLLFVFLLSARATYFSLSFVLFVYTFYSVYHFVKNKKLVTYTINFLSVSLIILFAQWLPSSYISLSSRVSSISTADVSANLRITLWENALDYISQSPFIGCGLGNWKVESLQYWRDMLSGYTIPYHAHNDFLELATEIGILGALSYILIFVTILIMLYNRFRSTDFSFVSFIILSGIIAYTVDALLNFPLERAINQVNFGLIIALTSLYYKNEKV